MKIAELEKKSGLPRDTIRYYEKIGLLPRPLRSANGYRVYSKVHLQALGFIEKGKAIGFSLKSIKAGFQRYQALGHMCPEFKRQLQSKKRFFEKRIEDDQAVISEIDRMLNW